MIVAKKEDEPVSQTDERECTSILAPRCFLVIENVFLWHTGDVGLGSLFLTDNNLYFIEYLELMTSSIQVGGSLSSGAIRDAIGNARSRKQEEWGLPIEEIYKRHEQSLLVPRNEIVRIDLIQVIGNEQNAKIAVHLLNGNTLYFLRMDSLSYGRPYVGDQEHDLDRYAQELVAYGQGLDVLNPEHWKGYGLYIDFPAPLIFVESVLSSSFHSVFSDEMLPKIAGNSKYMDTLFSLVDEKQNSKNQRDLLNFIPELPEFFRAEFKKRLRAELPVLGGLVIAFTSILVVGCIIIGVILSVNFSTPVEDLPGLPTLFGLFLIVIGLIGAVTAKVKRNRYTDLIEK